MNGSRVSQGCLHLHCERVRVTENAPRDPSSVLERRHGLAEIVERRAVVLVERPRVNPPHPERGVITISECAARYRNRLVQQRLGFFEAI